jgi:hypothetical protein
MRRRCLPASVAIDHLEALATGLDEDAVATRLAGYSCARAVEVLQAATAQALVLYLNRQTAHATVRTVDRLYPPHLAVVLTAVDIGATVAELSVHPLPSTAAVRTTLFESFLRNVGPFPRSTWLRTRSTISGSTTYFDEVLHDARAMLRVVHLWMELQSEAV